MRTLECEGRGTQFKIARRLDIQSVADVERRVEMIESKPSPMLDP